jgi:hypothetical protein
MESFKSGEVTCAFSECSSNARAIGAADAPLQAFRHARFDRTFQTSLPLKMSPPSCPGQVVLKVRTSISITSPRSAWRGPSKNILHHAAHRNARH